MVLVTPKAHLVTRLNPEIVPQRLRNHHLALRPHHMSHTVEYNSVPNAPDTPRSLDGWVGGPRREKRSASADDEASGHLKFQPEVAATRNRVVQPSFFPSGEEGDTGNAMTRFRPVRGDPPRSPFAKGCAETGYVGNGLPPRSEYESH